MAIALTGTFDVWLTEKLTSVSSDIDTDVFVSYIIGILDSDSSEKENEESITELLAGVVELDVAKDVSIFIISQWKADLESKKRSQAKEDVGDKLSMMFEKQTLATVKERKLTKEEAARKAAILAQYGQVSDGEECDLEEEAVEDAAPSSGVGGAVGSKARGDTSEPLLVRNVNKEEVQRVEREKREKAKEEQEKKKEKDKLDRQAQKQKQQERKETEKKRTQKGEKRR